MATPSLGTAFSDGVRIGSLTSADFNFGALGASLSPTMTYDIVPAAATPIAGNLAIAAGAVPLVANAPMTLVSYQGYANVLKLDVCRTLNFAVVTGPTPNVIVLTISGWDFWGHKVVENVTIPNASATNFLISSVKSYAYIKSIYASASSGSAVIGMGTGLGFGLPFYIPDKTLAYVEWAGRPDYTVTTPGSPGFAYINAQASSIRPYVANGSVFQVGDATDPATATTEDPRGVYYINPSYTFPFSSTRLVIDMYVPAFDPMYGTVLSPSISAPSTAYAYGVPQYSTGWQ